MQGLNRKRLENTSSVKSLCRKVWCLRSGVQCLNCRGRVGYCCPDRTMCLYWSVSQDIYVRKVERVGGELQNTVIQTYQNVSQFWTWTPEEFLKRGPYKR